MKGLKYFFISMLLSISHSTFPISEDDLASLQKPLDAAKEILHNVLDANDVDESTQAIVANAANMFGNFFVLKQDPNNFDHVCSNAANIILNMNEIIKEGTKSIEISYDSQEEELITRSASLHRKIPSDLAEAIDTLLESIESLKNVGSNLEE